MKQLGRVSLCLAILLLFAAAVSVLTDKTAEATNPLLVTVANTPLPVQGSISVANEPSVNVANTPNVNVANTSLPITGKVTVANALDSGNNPIPLAVQPQGQPYVGACGMPSQGTICSVLPTIPAGMRLVIQEFDFRGNSPSGTTIFSVALATPANNSDFFHEFIVNNQGQTGFGDTVYVTHQQTTLFADSTGPLRCSIGATAPPDAAVCNISGYLVPAQ